MTSVFKGKKTFKRKLNIFFFIVCTDGSSISHGGISYQRTGSGKFRSSSGALVPGSAMGAIFSSKFSYIPHFFLLLLDTGDIIRDSWQYIIVPLRTLGINCKSKGKFQIFHDSFTVSRNFKEFKTSSHY